MVVMVNILLVLCFVWTSCAHYSAVQEEPLKVKKEDKNANKLGPSGKSAEAKVEETVGRYNEKQQLSLRYRKKHYRHWLEYFSGKNKKRFLRQLRNGDKYREIVRSVFKKHGLPEDLFYVGLIESGFYTHARSHASAVGPWQFIRGTGKRYKLRIDRHVDERRSIYKSTEAAAQYFKDLYNIFGSWELALCAYNAGEYRIINAIRKGNTRNYKKLVKKKLIPKETIFYIPKVVVARHLDKKWQRTLDVKSQNFYNNVDFLKIEKTINLAKIAKNIGVSWKTLKKLNPDLNSYWIRPRRRGFVLYLPVGKKQIAMNHLKKLGYDIKKRLVKKQRSRYHRSQGTTKGYYRVRRGDSLIGIAKKFATTVRRIKTENRLRSGKILVGQRLRVPASKKHSKKHYVVRRGDSLIGIAKKFATTVRRIKTENRLRSGKILVGQRLRVPASKIRKRKYYVVRKGDNLTRIAQRFGVSIKHLLRINRLKNQIIYPRQRIIIPSG